MSDASEETKVEQAVEAPKKRGRRAAAKKEAEPQDVVDLKNPKLGWPIIMVDEVEGQPNYEVVGINGKVYQIKRGEDVPVPPEVVSVLKDATAERVVQVPDHVNGGVITKRQKYAAVPWRVVGYVQ